MKNSAGTLDLGSILCKRCGALIDTLDTEKVTVYYSECRQGECMKEAVLENKQGFDEKGNIYLDC